MHYGCSHLKLDLITHMYEYAVILVIANRICA